MKEINRIHQERKKAFERFEECCRELEKSVKDFDILTSQMIDAIESYQNDLIKKALES